MQLSPLRGGYRGEVAKELATWQRNMQRSPSILSKLSKKIQTKINSWIPEKIHNGITTAIKNLVQGVLFGAKLTTSKNNTSTELEIIETAVKERIKFYQSTAAVEGGITGAGGLLLGLADFPILLGIKMKLLFEIASLYGFNVNQYKERIYILHIFELAFSSAEHRNKTYSKIANWHHISKTLPENIQDFEWRNFQQEYRDYLDIAKLAQLIPVIGAPVGVVVNYKLIKRLGYIAMNAYRMRIL